MIGWENNRDDDITISLSLKAIGSAVSKLFANLLKKTKMFTKPLTRALRYTNQILLSSNRLELSPWSFTHVFKKIETTMRWNCMSKALRLVQITVEHQDCQFFTVFLTIKTSSQNISITLLQISLKLHEHRGGYWRKRLPWTILEEQFPVPRYTAASKIGYSVISLLWAMTTPMSWQPWSQQIFIFI